MSPSPGLRIDEEVLFAMDEPEVMFPVDRAANAPQASYLGWRILSEVGYVDEPLGASMIRAEQRYMARFTAEPSAEETHRFCDENTPGAALYWWVVVDL